MSFKTKCSRAGKRKMSVQFSSVTQSCPTLCDPMNRSTPGLPVHHQLPEFTQTHVQWVRDAIQPSHPLSSPSPPAPNPSQHQSLFQWVSSLHEVAKVLEFQLRWVLAASFLFSLKLGDTTFAKSVSLACLHLHRHRDKWKPEVPGSPVTLGLPMLLTGDRDLSVIDHIDVLFSQTFFANPGICAFQGYQEDRMYPSLSL